MSKFSDKLDRLHASRVRALEADDTLGEQQRVFVAEPEIPTRTPAASPPAVTPTPTPRAPVEDSPAREAVRAQLEFGERMQGRGRRPPRVTMARTADVAQPAPRPSPGRSTTTGQSDNAVGERLADLRVRADALISVGGLESALALLHEMAALSPTHPYPLTQLAEYWRGQGNTRLATLYADRLAAIAPY